jgi:hypothetical protein
VWAFFYAKKGRMNMSCENKKLGCPATVDSKHYHPQNNQMYAHGCPPCGTAKCEDIREGTFDFTGPAVLLGVCNIHKSYLVVRDVPGDCEVRAGAIFPGSRTEHFPDDASMEFSLPGNYTVKYKWDNCCESEPQFDALPYPCPCKPE